MWLNMWMQIIRNCINSCHKSRRTAKRCITAISKSVRNSLMCDMKDRTEFSLALDKQISKSRRPFCPLKSTIFVQERIAKQMNYPVIYPNKMAVNREGFKPFCGTPKLMLKFLKRKTKNIPRIRKLNLVL